VRRASARARQTAARATILVGLTLCGAACGKDARGPTYVAPICAAGQLPCGQRCFDPATDAANCGGCGIPCGVDQVCQAGACQCVSGVVCNGACVAADANGCADGRTSTLVTSAPGAYWQTDGMLTEVASGNADVTVDDGSIAQVWEGFGGAFNEMGWDVLSLLSDTDRDTALHLLYGADGARFAFGRIPIGASDYATDRYTLDETPGDTALTGFSIDRDMEKLIPFVKAAQAVKPGIRFWASPWTPPTWMKAPPYSAGQAVSPFDGGTMKDDDASMNGFASYLTRFVQAYAEQGIAIETISPQNEPNYTGNYPTCAWSPATYTKFVGQYLAPAVAAAGLGTKIMLGTFNGGGSDPSIVDTVMGDAAAGNAIAVLGFQWGMQAQVARDRAYELPIWQTEHKCGNYPWGKPFDAAAAPNDQAYAVESWGLIRDWIRAGVTAYSAWNMVLDTVGVGIDTTRVWPQNALLVVDTSTKTLIITPAYYVFRHVSQFVAPGARVLATTGGDALGFKNPDGSVVAVLYNPGSARALTVSLAGRRLKVSVPGAAWATIVSR
jgi:glucosylceramidase